MATIGGVVRGTAYITAGAAILGPVFLTVAQGGTWIAGAGATLDLAGNALNGAGDLAHALIPTTT